MSIMLLKSNAPVNQTREMTPVNNQTKSRHAKIKTCLYYGGYAYNLYLEHALPPCVFVFGV